MAKFNNISGQFTTIVAIKIIFAISLHHHSHFLPLQFLKTFPFILAILNRAALFFIVGLFLNLYHIFL